MPHILIVEDDDALRGELVELLRALGASAVGAADGASAMQASSMQAFDLVLCDYKLQSENGLDVLKAIVARGEAPAQCHCYLMTAHIEMTRSAREDIAATTGGLLQKPIGAGTLRRIVAAAGEGWRC